MNLAKMSFTEKSAKSRIPVLVLMTMLILYYAYSHIANGVDIAFRITISTLPLLIFFPGILKRKYRSASLLCFVLLLYFMAGVQSLFTPGNTLPESIAMTIICSLFCIAMMYSRWQQRADVLEAPEAQS